MHDSIDPVFLAHQPQSIAETGLAHASKRGARHASVRLEQTRHAETILLDGVLAGEGDTTELGLSVQVRPNGGATGFAATTEISPGAVTSAVDHAIAMATASSRIGGDYGEPADEPIYRDEVWLSDYRVNPFTIAADERARFLAKWSDALLKHDDVASVHAKLVAVQETKFYADLAGTTTTQQRVRVHPRVTITGRRADGSAETVSTLGPPTGRGWEYLLGDGWDWEAEIAELPGHLSDKLRATELADGCYDLVADPSHLWLTIHETIGHATELDRALGHEMSYAGATFTAPHDIGTLRFGSPLLNVIAERTSAHGLATVGFDDQGVAAQRWPLIEDGVLTGFQTDRDTAVALGAARSTGCAFAGSALHPPLSRLPNVSVLPGEDDVTTRHLIGDVRDGVYVVGPSSWSIDMRRSNFQFTADRCYRIRNGRLTHQLRDVAYQWNTTDLWRSLAALGGERSYQTFGADLCGKGRPVQIAAASHGSPPALFRNVPMRTIDGTR